MDPFLEKKWYHVFNNFFDLNGNGTLEWEDFEILMQRIVVLRTPAPKEVELLKRNIEEIWKSLTSFLKKRRGIEDVVTLNEWENMWFKSLSNKEFPKWQESYLHYTFNLLDTSGDGLVDCSEYVEMMMIYGVEKTNAENAFEKFAFSEGRPVNAISYDQFRSHWNEYFHSKDRNNPGNFLFGYYDFGV